MNRRPPTVDRPAAERAIADFLRALGRDPEHDLDLVGTPERVVQAWDGELLSGEGVDALDLVRRGTVAMSGTPSVIVVRDIQVATLCPHHLLPAEGQATVAYLPALELLGLGTVARLVDVLSRRLTLQERIGEGVVQALLDGVGAKAAFCHLRLRHACLRLRGATEPTAVVETTALGGSFREPGGMQQLDLALRMGAHG